MIEVFDLLNDMFEVDCMSDVVMSGSIILIKVDKLSWYGRLGFVGKKYMFGWGEIRVYREFVGGDVVCKCKRVNFDCDVSSVVCCVY